MRAAVVGLVLGLVACHSPTNPDGLPDGAVWVDPVPVAYAEDWRAVEACSGLTGDFDSVRWAVFPGRLVIPGTKNALGRTIHAKRLIFMAGRAKAPPRRHEILHMLMGPDGDSHPDAAFGPSAPCYYLVER